MDDKEIVWYVRDGQMISSWIIAQLDFDYQVIDGNDDVRYLGYFMKGNGDTTNSIPSGLVEMANRPGVWYLLGGMQIVHIDDIYHTRELAAEAEYERLLNGGSS